jgi:hypothetical protein
VLFSNAEVFESLMLHDPSRFTLPPPSIQQDVESLFWVLYWIILKNDGSARDLVNEYRSSRFLLCFRIRDFKWPHSGETSLYRSLYPLSMKLHVILQMSNPSTQPQDLLNEFHAAFSELEVKLREEAEEAEVAAAMQVDDASENS